MNLIQYTIKQAGIRYLIGLFLLPLLSLAVAPSGPELSALPASMASVGQPEQAPHHPIHFLENKGQVHDMNGQAMPTVLFLAQAPGLTVYITEQGLTYLFLKADPPAKRPSPEEQLEQREPPKIPLRWERVDVVLKGALISKENLVKETPGAEHFDYYLGHCPQGIRDVKQYEKMTIRNVYPGIDWVFYNAADQGFKYDFVVHPGADPSRIEWFYRAEQPASLQTNGNIALNGQIAKLTETAPRSFSGTQVIRSGFRTGTVKSLKKEKGYESHFRLNLDAYDHRQDLVIDPQMVWGTYFGGNVIDYINQLEIDVFNNLFMTGDSYGGGFPTVNSGGYFQGVIGSTVAYDAFVSKFNNAGVLMWSTYYGGSSNEHGLGIESDMNGNIFVCGSSGSTNLPLQNSGTYFQSVLGGPHANSNAFLLKFDNNGNRLWATYYGGDSVDYAMHMAIDAAGNLFVTGTTISFNFPVMNAGTYFQTNTDSVEDIFLLKFDNLGNQLWATYYAGSDKEYGNCVVVDAFNNIFVTGTTKSNDLPLQNTGTFFQGTYNSGVPWNGNLLGISDAFLLKFDNNGNRLYGSYFGGNSLDKGMSMVVDQNNNLFLASTVCSSNMPVLNNGAFFQGSFSSAYDAFFAKFDNNLNLLWGTYYGSGPSYEMITNTKSITVDACGNLYVGMAIVGTELIYPPCETGGYCAFVPGGSYLIKFSNNGHLIWATYLGQNSFTPSYSSAQVDQNNNLFFACQAFTFGLGAFPTIDPGGGAYYDSSPNLAAIICLYKFSPTPLGTLQYASPVCLGAPTNPVPLNNLSGSNGCSFTGTYSAGPGLAIDAATGEIHLNGSSPGTYTVHYSVPATLCAQASAGTATITLQPSGVPPAISFSYAPFCMGGATPCPLPRPDLRRGVIIWPAPVCWPIS